MEGLFQLPSIPVPAALAVPHPDLPSSAACLAFRPLRLRVRLVASARLYSSGPPSGANVSVGDPDPGGGGELQYALPPPPRLAVGAPVFVALPVDAVGPGGRVSRRKAMTASFMALAAAGVEGVAMEVWWGIVERDAPGAYDWEGYVDLVSLARRFRLKVRVIMAFHQFGCGPSDPCWISLPQWVLAEMEADPDLAYSDRLGRRSMEYISLGSDVLPLLRGRTPIQAYSDFMRNFRDRFREFLGVVITELQVGMGPAGELRYPSSPSLKLVQPSSTPELGEFQCYDKYMLSSLNACAQNIGMSAWGGGGPLGASNLLQNPEGTSFFKNDGSWNAAYGRFFLEWYSGLLLLHGERLCITADSVFWDTGVKILAKVAGVHWHYGINSHPSELTSGYYNTLTRDGYLPIARLFGKYRMIMCCPCFDMRDEEVEQISPKSSPEGFLKQLVCAARMCNLELTGEITRLDDASLGQAVRTSKLYKDGPHDHTLSFNFVRMNRNLFDSHNWSRFAGFVRQMSDARTFQAKLGGARGLCHPSTTTSEEHGRARVFKKPLLVRH